MNEDQFSIAPQQRIKSPKGGFFSAIGASLCVVTMVALLCDSLTASEVTWIDGKTYTVTEKVAPAQTPSPTPAQSENRITTQNMTRGDDGVYRSIDLAKNGKAYVQIAPPKAPTYGQTAILSGSRRTNVAMDGTKNIKIIRNWPERTYPNDYCARSLRTGAEQFSTEGAGTQGTLGYFKYPQSLNNWVTEVYEYKYSSAPGKADGEVKITIGGNVVFERKGWISGDGTRTAFGFQCVYAPNTGDSGPLPIGSYVEFQSVSLVIR